MAVRTILPLEHPLLRRQAKKVHRFDRALERLVADLFETLYHADGAGLAAPQVGQSLRVFVAEYEGQQFALFNPEIVRASGVKIGAEGCLSLPGFVHLDGILFTDQRPSLSTTFLPGSRGDISP